MRNNNIIFQDQARSPYEKC